MSTPSGSDEVYDAFFDITGSIEEAEDLANKYITEGAWGTVPEWFQVQNEIPGFFDLPDYIGDVMNEFNRVFEIGCDFDGVLQIVEYENKQVYIPTSYHCALKCMEKFLGITLEKRRASKLPTGKEINPYKLTTNGIRSVLDYNKIPKEKYPYFVRWRFDKKSGSERFIPLSGGKRPSQGPVIALIHIQKAEYHAVLLKTGKFYNKLTQPQIKALIKLKRSMELSDAHESQTSLPIRISNRVRYVFSYDIETYTETLPDGSKNLIPYGICYQRIDLLEKSISKPILFASTNAIAEFIEHIFQNNTDIKTFYIYAHNGGKFDNIFWKTYTANPDTGAFIQFTKQIKAGGSIKGLYGIFHTNTFDANEKEICKTFKLLDTLCFTQLSLKMSCIALKTEHQKMDFDIIDKPLEFYESTEDWKEYLYMDVICLSEIILKVDEAFSEFGESITSSCGLPGIAWNIISKSCYLMEKVFITKCPITSRFIRQSVYGGRVIHYRKTYSSKSDSNHLPGLISLDANSLYPAAMTKGLYPIGRYRVMNDPNNQIYTLINQNHLFIAEVTLDAGNVRYPLVPFRTEQGSVIYPAGQFSGVYTSVDIGEALSLGYKIISCKRGIYWRQSGHIFKELITALYEMRKKLKAEGNSLEYTYKILYNSGYGKFLQLIKSRTKFCATEMEPKELAAIRDYRYKILPNGQYEYALLERYQYSDKPAEIGAFILSYARSIMNTAFAAIGPENIFYSDTDSLYTYRDLAYKVQQGNDLGQFKNDYGDGTYIDEAIFLDIKRYFLQFNSGGSKSKFNGLEFAKGHGIIASCKSDIFNTTGSDTEKEKQIYEYFLKNPGGTITFALERWQRLLDSVRISKRDYNYTINPMMRADWKEADYYPKQYDHTKQQRSFEYDFGHNMIGLCDKTRTKQYSITRNKFKSSLPLMADKEFVLDRHVLRGYPCSFIQYNGQIYYETRTGSKEGGYNYKYYSMSNYGRAYLVSNDTHEEIVNAIDQHKICITIKKKDAINPNYTIEHEELKSLANNLQKFVSLLTSS